MATVGNLRAEVDLNARPFVKGAEQVANAANKMVDKIGGSGPGGLKGALDNINKTAGASSGIGTLMSTLAGGAAAAAVIQLANKVTAFATEANKAALAWANGEMSTKAMVDQLASGIPIVGDLYKAFTSVFELITQKGNLQILQDGIDAANKSLDAMLEKLKLAALKRGPEGDYKAAAKTIKNEYSAPLRAANEELKKARDNLQAVNKSTQFGEGIAALFGIVGIIVAHTQADDWEAQINTAMKRVDAAKRKVDEIQALAREERNAGLEALDKEHNKGISLIAVYEQIRKGAAGIRKEWENITKAAGKSLKPWADAWYDFIHGWRKVVKAPETKALEPPSAVLYGSDEDVKLNFQQSTSAIRSLQTTVQTIGTQQLQEFRTATARLGEIITQLGNLGSKAIQTVSITP